MADKRVTPLSSRVPIVDSEGNPTLEFMLKWQQQNTINNDIPVLPATPGDPTKFLSGTTPSTWLTPPDTTYGIVTASAAGLAPTLPADATKYLDGSGAWSTPAGGGGGGAPVLGFPAPGNSFSESYATVGAAFAVHTGVNIAAVQATLDVPAGATYEIAVAPFDTSTLEISGVISRITSPVVSGTGTGQVIIGKFGAAVSLTPGDYIAFFTRTDGSSTISQGLYYTSGVTSFLGGVFYLASAAYLLASTTPAIGDTWTFDGDATWAIGVAGTLA